jgi:hypothetical protein
MEGAENIVQSEFDKMYVPNLLLLLSHMRSLFRFARLCDNKDPTLIGAVDDEQSEWDDGNNEAGDSADENVGGYGVANDVEQGPVPASEPDDAPGLLTGVFSTKDVRAAFKNVSDKGYINKLVKSQAERERREPNGESPCWFYVEGLLDKYISSSAPRSQLLFVRRSERRRQLSKRQQRIPGRSTTNSARMDRLLQRIKMANTPLPFYDADGLLRPGGRVAYGFLEGAFSCTIKSRDRKKDKWKREFWNVVFDDNDKMRLLLEATKQCDYSLDASGNLKLIEGTWCILPNEEEGTDDDSSGVSGTGGESGDEKVVCDLHDDLCRECGRGGNILCCDFCTLVYHLGCANPPLRSLPEGAWACPECSVDSWDNKGKDVQMAGVNSSRNGTRAGSMQELRGKVEKTKAKKMRGKRKGVPKAGSATRAEQVKRVRFSLVDEVSTGGERPTVGSGASTGTASAARAGTGGSHPITVHFPAVRKKNLLKISSKHTLKKQTFTPPAVRTSLIAAATSTSTTSAPSTSTTSATSTNTTSATSAINTPSSTAAINVLTPRRKRPKMQFTQPPPTDATLQQPKYCPQEKQEKQEKQEMQEMQEMQEKQEKQEKPQARLAPAPLVSLSLADLDTNQRSFGCEWCLIPPPPPPPLPPLPAALVAAKLATTTAGTEDTAVMGLKAISVNMKVKVSEIASEGNSGMKSSARKRDRVPPLPASWVSIVRPLVSAELGVYVGGGPLPPGAKSQLRDI